MRLKYFHILSVLLLLNVCCWHANTKDFIIRGVMQCRSGTNTVNLPADAFIIAVPDIDPQAAALLHADGSFNIASESSKGFIDKNTTIKFYIQNHLVGQTKIFLGSEAVQNEEEAILFIIRQPIVIRETCAGLNFDNTKLSVRNLSKEKKGYANRTESPMLLGIGMAAGLGSLLLFPYMNPTPPPQPDSTVTEIFPIHSMQYPGTNLLDFYSSLFSCNSPFRGMHYAPTKDFEVSPILNSAYLAFSNFRNVSLTTDFKNYFQLYSTIFIWQHVSIGAGTIWLMESEQSIATLANNELYKANDLSRFYQALAAAAFKINDRFSFGLTTKYIRQILQYPIELRRTREYRDGKEDSCEDAFRMDETRISHTDCDASFAFIPNSSWRLGMTIFNLSGSRFSYRNGELINMRSVGFGFSYKKRRLAAGLDVFAMPGAKTVASVSMTYILCNWIDLHASYATAANSFQLGFAVTDPIARIGYTSGRHQMPYSSHGVGVNAKY